MVRNPRKARLYPAERGLPVVWSILYGVMAVSAWIAWRAPGKDEDRKLAFIWFFIQLAIGVLWSYAFIWLHSPGFELAVMMALLIAIVITIVLFDRLSGTFARPLWRYGCASPPGSTPPSGSSMAEGRWALNATAPRN
ncbi:MAG: TspO/MBR family protein [Methyloceanibacter sp.]|uniref:TspO/MBR family protein n=1 Tax=Methyloceanibacter sp. TaxID=1965321 RepID=UPI003D9B63B5